MIVCEQSNSSSKALLFCVCCLARANKSATGFSAAACSLDAAIWYSDRNRELHRAQATAKWLLQALGFREQKRIRHLAVRKHHLFITTCRHHFADVVLKNLILRVCPAPFPAPCRFTYFLRCRLDWCHGARQFTQALCGFVGSHINRRVDREIGKVRN